MTVNALKAMIDLLRADTVVAAEVGSIRVYGQTLPAAITGEIDKRMGQAYASADGAGERGGRAGKDWRGAFELAALRRALLREGAWRDLGSIKIEPHNI